MLASRRFQVVLACGVSAITLARASREAYNPQHIVLGKNGQVQDVDPSLYFHERIRPRAPIVRNTFTHAQQHQLKTTSHTPQPLTPSPKLSISRVDDGVARPIPTVENKPQVVSAHVTRFTEAKTPPPAHKKEVATTKKTEAVAASNPLDSANKPKPQRRFGSAECRFQAQDSDFDDFAQTQASTNKPEQADEVPEVALLVQAESFESALPGVPGSILFAEMSCIFVGFIGYLVHSIPLWARFSRGQRWCLVVAFSVALLYQLAALSWYLDWVSPEVMIGLSSLITRMISLGMVPITTTSFVGRAREACADQAGAGMAQLQTPQLATTSHNNSRGSRHPRARAS